MKTIDLGPCDTIALTKEIQWDPAHLWSLNEGKDELHDCSRNGTNLSDPKNLLLKVNGYIITFVLRASAFFRQDRDCIWLGAQPKWISLGKTWFSWIITTHTAYTCFSTLTTSKCATTDDLVFLYNGISSLVIAKPANNGAFERIRMANILVSLSDEVSWVQILISPHNPVSKDWLNIDVISRGVLVFLESKGGKHHCCCSPQRILRKKAARTKPTRCYLYSKLWQYATYLLPKPKYFEMLCLASGLSCPSGVRCLLGSYLSGSVHSLALIALFLVARLKESTNSFYAPGVENDNAPYRANYVKWSTDILKNIPFGMWYPS